MIFCKVMSETEGGEETKYQFKFGLAVASLGSIKVKSREMTPELVKIKEMQKSRDPLTDFKRSLSKKSDLDSMESAQNPLS